MGIPVTQLSQQKKIKDILFDVSNGNILYCSNVSLSNFIWNIEEWILEGEGNNQFEVKKLKFSINTNYLIQNIKNILFQKYKDIFVDLYYMQQSSKEFWIFFEFNFQDYLRQSSSKKIEKALLKLNSGICGVKLYVLNENNLLSLCISDHFGLGKFPPDLLIHFVKIVQKALDISLTTFNFLVNTNNVSVYHLSISPKIILSQLEQRFLLPEYSLKFSKDYELYETGHFIIEPKNQVQLNVIRTQDILNLKTVPLEILENKELDLQIKNIDTQILKLNFNRIKIKFQKCWAQYLDNISALKRFVLVNIAKATHLYLKFITNRLKIEPENLLFLSYMFQVKYKDFPTSQPLLEDIFKILIKKIPQLEGNTQIKKIFVKLFGYIYKDVNHDKAEKYFLTYLKYDKDAVDILYNLQGVYEKQKRYQNQEKLLQLLLQQNINEKFQAIVHKKLFYIYAQHNKSLDDAIKHGLVALQYLPHDYDLLFNVIETMLLTKQEQQTINLIQRVLEKNPNITSSIKIKLKMKLAMLWINVFKRQDLAKKHLEDIYEENSNNIQLLEYLEKIYTEENNPQKLIAILQNKFNCEFNAHDKNILQTFTKLFDLYINVDLNFNSAFSILTKYFDVFGVSAEVLNELLKYDSKVIDWSLVYEQILQRIDIGNIDDNVLVALLQICVQKLNNCHLALKYLNQIKDFSQINKDVFNKLVYFIVQTQQYEHLLYICETNENLALEYKDFIKSIFNNTNISIDSKERLSLIIYSKDPQELQIIHEVLNYYKKELNYIRFVNFLDKVLSIHKIITLRQYWLEYSIEQILNMPYNSDIGAKLEYYIEELVKTSEDYYSKIHEILKTTLDSNYGNLKILSKYCIALLNNDIFPQIDQNHFDKLLQDEPLLLADVYLKLADQHSNNIQEYINYLNKALVLYKSYSPDNHDKILHILYECGKNIILSKDQLEEIKVLSKIKNNISLYFEILKIQKDKVTNKTQKVEIIKEAAQVAVKELNNIIEAAHLYQEAIQFADNKWEIYLILHRLYEDNNDFKQSEYYLKQIVLDKHFLYSNVELFNDFINKLIKKYAQQDFVEQTINAYLPEIEQNHDNQFIYYFSKMLIRLHIFNSKIYEKFIEHCIRVKDIDSLKDAFLTATQHINETKVVKDLFIKIKLSLNQKELNSEEWLLFLTKVTNEIENTILHKSIKNQVITDIALEFFENNFNIQKAYELMQESYILNRSDERIWIPLYLLKKDFASANDLKQYLEEIIPKVVQHKSVMKNYPVTVETLLTELQKISNESASKILQLISEQQKKPATNVSQKSPMLPEKAFDANSSTATTNNKEKLSVYSTSGSNMFNWREAVLRLDIPPNATTLIFNYPFENTLEKHVALQCMALLTGNFEELYKWQWQVWRYPAQYSYPLKASLRIPKGVMHIKHQSPAFKLILLLNNFLAKTNRNTFSLRNILKNHNYDPKNFEQKTQKVELEDNFFQEIGLDKYSQKIINQKYKFINLEGIKEKIYFIPINRTFYFDKKFYAKFPPSVAFHRFLTYIYSIDLSYFIYLNLDVQNGVLPQLYYLNEYLSSSFFSKILKSLDPVYIDIIKSSITIDRNHFKLLYQKADLSLETLQEIKMMMLQHIYKIIIAETLDIIGLFESIVLQDLLTQDLTNQQILKLSPHFKELLEYVTQLEL